MVLSSRRKRRENVSKANGEEKEKIPEVVLPNSRLKFCGDQLQNLNYIFSKNCTKEADIETSKTLLLATSVTERLIQRLVCGIGILDSRFSSKFLIALHDSKINNCKSPKLEYILRLDSLSKPSLYTSDEIPKYSITEGDLENCPPSYARIRLHPPWNKAWSEFLNPMGYLRRDRIQAKVIELLALAAAGNSPVSSLLVDESVLCGSPGKVVDAYTLHNILQQPSSHQLFYGDAGKNPRFPDPRDFKLAILDKPNGIFIRLGFLSPALTSVTMEVRLLVAIGLHAWPSSATFPFRITLNHSDSVLYHRAAQTGMYLTGYGVHSSAWQIRLPAAETFLEQHYSKTSAISIISQTLCDIPRNIDEEYRRHQVIYRILNRYAMRSYMLYSLEEDASNPTKTILNWSPVFMSTIVLKILDGLINALRNQKQSNYFFPSANLLVNPGHLCEDDYVLESNKIKAYMLKLFDMSLTSFSGDEAFSKFLVMQQIEMNLLRKWRYLVDGFVPVSSLPRNKCCRLFKRRYEDVYGQYTARQIEYIGIVLKNMLMVKHYILQSPDDVEWTTILTNGSAKENAIEDVIYILTFLIKQARDEYIETLTKNPREAKKLPIIKQKIGEALLNLLELMRTENELTNIEYLDDCTLVTTILKWLNKGVEHKQKHLRSLLQPYLKKLFITSHCISWHLETISRKEALEEVSSLCLFAKLVNSSKITPAQGLIDSVIKNWEWAKSMLGMLKEGPLRLFFIPEKERVIKHVLTLPPNIKHTLSKSLHDLSCANVSRGKNSFSTLLDNSQQKNKLATGFVSPHCILRDKNPMHLMFSQLHRNGEYRCAGDVLATLLAMQKANVVLEVSAPLPNEERIQILEAIEKIQGEQNHKPVCKPKSSTLRPKSHSSFFNGTLEDQEKYTPKEESAGIKDDRITTLPGTDEVAAIHRDTKVSKNRVSTLIGSCRAVRVREDNSITRLKDNFKMHSLKKYSSFKY